MSCEISWQVYRSLFATCAVPPDLDLDKVKQESHGLDLKHTISPKF